MSFCPQCGRPVDPALHFCPACGASRTPTAGAPGAQPPARAPPAAGSPGFGSAAPPAYAPAAPQAEAWGGSAPVPPGPAGPVGRTQEPWLVLVLMLVTLGFYGLFYLLRVSREVDDYTQRPGHAGRKVRLGLLLFLGAVVLLVAGFAFAAAAAPSEAELAGGTEPDAGGLGAFLLFVFLGMGLALAGGILMLIGQWRIWKTIEEDERRRGVPKPLSPGLMLVFMLIPYVSIVTMWIAYYRTQTGLNGMWAAAGQAPQAVYS